MLIFNWSLSLLTKYVINKSVRGFKTLRAHLTARSPRRGKLEIWMKFECCGVVYSTRDIDTFECIEAEVIDDPLIKEHNGHKIHKEIVYTLTCKKNQCTKVRVLRYGKVLNKNKIVQDIKLSRLGAIEYLQKTEELRRSLPQRCPTKKIPTSKRIPLVYGASIGEEEQCARYLDESGYREKFELTEIEYFDWKAFMPRKEYVNRWAPDIIHSPIKRSNLNDISN